jgi:hypothetical protein
MFKQLFSIRPLLLLAFALPLAASAACSSATFSSLPADGSAGSEDAGDGGNPAIANPGDDAATPTPEASTDAGVLESGADVEAASPAGDGEAGSACLAPNLSCDSGCVPSDVKNCGTCGTACTSPANAAPACAPSAGGYACAWSCNSGYSPCSSACVDLSTDLANCGGCGSACTTAVANAQPSCANRVCSFACNAGHHACGTGGATTCASDSSVNSCGSSCAACPAPANATASCAASAGTYACGWSCNSSYSQCGSACANLQTDPSNCGTCGHGCLYGTCAAGQCQPWIVAQTTSGVLDLARVAMASDGTNLVWLDSQKGVSEVPVAGGTPIALDSTPVTTNFVSGFVNVAMANGIVAWTLADSTNGIEIRTAKEGIANSGSAVSVQSGSAGRYPWGLSLNASGTAAFFNSESTSTSAANLFTVNLGSTVFFTELMPTSASASNSGGNDVAVAGNYVFWTNSTNGGILRYTLSDGSLAPVATGQGNSYRLAVDGTYVYWLNGGPNVSSFSVSRTSQAAPSAPQIVLPTLIGASEAFATDGTNVYFAGAVTTSGTTVGEVGYVPVAGGSTPKALYSGQDLPYDVITAGGAVFWLDASTYTIYGIRAP